MELFEVLIKNVHNCLVNRRPDSYRIICFLGDYGKIISWNTTSWTRIGSKKITREAISAFAVSPDGTLLAL
jgi:prolactin regulatory element-binding protein